LKFKLAFSSDRLSAAFLQVRFDQPSRKYGWDEVSKIRQLLQGFPGKDQQCHISSQL
jgi:hypothetical protein